MRRERRKDRKVPAPASPASSATCPRIAAVPAHTVSLTAVRPPSPATPRIGPLDVLLLAGWCGLAAGLLEVGTRILCRLINPTNRLYQVSRHFVWLSPLVYLLLFLAMGFFLAAVTRLWPRRGGWLSPRLIVGAAFVPALMVAGPQIYTEAWMILALGIATRLVPSIERHAMGLRRRLVLSFPGLVGGAHALGRYRLRGDRLKERREAGRPLPPADSPNVLLIVLDTVRADHLSLYGYHRATTPDLERLAKRGILFDRVGDRALDPRLAREHVHGALATRDRRGMAHPAAARVSHPGRVPGISRLCDRGFRGQYPLLFLRHRHRPWVCALRGLRPRADQRRQDGPRGRLAFRSLSIWPGIRQEFRRGSVTSPARALLGWVLARDRDQRGIDQSRIRRLVGRRRETGRPFFAFLNYFDAHSPYVLTHGRPNPFGLRPRNATDAEVLDGLGRS